MADDIISDATTETQTADIAAPAKRTRGPNRKKTEPTATTSAEAPVKKTRAKRGEKAAAAQLIKAAKAEKATRVPRGTAATKQDNSNAPAAIAVSDDFSDLLKLEEENKLLRKELGEKLRAENADLKKKLGKG